MSKRTYAFLVLFISSLFLLYNIQVGSGFTSSKDYPDTLTLENGEFYTNIVDDCAIMYTGQVETPCNAEECGADNHDNGGEEEGVHVSASVFYVPPTHMAGYSNNAVLTLYEGFSFQWCAQRYNVTLFNRTHLVLDKIP